MNQKGLSLLEIILTMGLLGFVTIAALAMFGDGFEAFHRDDRFIRQQSAINQFVAVLRRDIEQASDVAVVNDKTLVLGYIKDKGLTAVNKDTPDFNNNTYAHRADNIELKVYHFHDDPNQVDPNQVRIKYIQAPTMLTDGADGKINLNKTGLQHEINSMTNANMLLDQIDVNNSSFLSDQITNLQFPWLVKDITKLYVKMKTQDSNTGKLSNANLKNILSYEFSLYGKYTFEVN